jgi:hypothetical protein
VAFKAMIGDISFFMPLAIAILVDLVSIILRRMKYVLINEK